MPKVLSFRVTSDHLLLCVFLSLLWGVSDSSTETTVATTTTTTTTQSTAPPTTKSPTTTTGISSTTETTVATTSTTQSTAPPTTKPPPGNVKEVKVLTQNESSITLTWDKVNNISTYWLEYHNNSYSNEVKINASDQETSVTHVVSPLTAGTKYVFTLFTVFEGVNSSGYTFQNVTAPENVEDVKVLTQNESSITLMWDKVDNISTYRLEYHNNSYSNEVKINASNQETSVTHVVSPLTAGTKYVFTLFTVFEGVNSSGHTFQNVTAPENVEDVKVLTQNESSITLMWDKVDNISTYWLEYHNNSSSDTDIINTSDQGTSVTHVVSPLTAGTFYYFTLFTEFEGVNSSGHTFQNVTAPENVEDVKVLTQNESSITLMWDKVDNISTYWLEYHNNSSSDTDIINTSDQGTSVTHVVSPLTAGTFYYFTLFTVFEGVNSSGYTFQNVTVPENVEDVKVLTQNESSITLTWDKVNNISTYWLEYHNNSYSNEVKINASDQGTSVTHVVFPLTAGTFYYFTLFTVFEGVNSSGYTFQNVTAPENVEDVKVLTQNESSITLTWDKVDNISTYWLEYHNNSYSNEVKINTSDQGTSVTHVVSPLTAGTFYYFTLFTVFEGVNSSGYTFQNVTAPENVKDVEVLTQKESSITLMWDKVDNISIYWLQYDNNGSSNTDIINESDQGTSFTHVVSPLTAGTKYVFTLFTVFEGVNSSGKTFQNFTVPPAVSSVSVTERSVTSITLAWSVDVDKDWSYFLQMNRESLSLPPDNSIDFVSHSFTSLQPGTKYRFSVITEFCGLKSTAYEDFTLTAIDCASVNWHVTNSSIQGMINGSFTNAAATVKSQVHLGNITDSNVTFTGLDPGATYEVSLVYEENSRSFNQCLPEPRITTNPPNLNAGCEYWAAGYSVNVAWDKPDGVWTAVEVKVNGETHNQTTQDGNQNMIIHGFLPARTYEVSVVSLSGNRRSDPYVFPCLTDPRGVIAGSVFAMLLFCVLVFLVLFILLKRPDIISGKVPFIVGSKLSNKKPKAISVAKFPDHFYQLNVDDNRGFSQEYESLIPVGTEQTRKEALLPENKARNRFNNVLPYDWCRVKLSTSNPNMTSDYINANYMPGYNSNREYIATQGPLPATVNDFWRMIWEQRVKGIVMVTNCTEGGRTKCEHYWPADSKPCLYGGLSVTMHSERQEPNWTLREFRLKHSNTSEERTVRHFHFTAWPDHGVPQGTEVLIQFRGLVRQHIEREGGGAPTVVHCSAGVGRTGTIIALDVLLQQLDQDKAVGINAFVHKMRLSRPHMVQTESQYVFLHQCIMDRLQPHDTTEEHIYENTDTIYVNATALRELHSSA